jgi:TetR/AcrR family transcriptional repressor of mexJK operon
MADLSDPPGRIRHGGGRPSREEAARRELRLIEEATRLFMERGFDATTIDAVAEAAGISKPTVYSRYKDKNALFEAVLKDRIEAWLAPLAAIADKASDGSGLRSALHDLSKRILSQSQAPGANSLRRVLAAQALQFPDLARLAHEHGWMGGVRAVAGLLRRYAERGDAEINDPDTAAELFMSLVLGSSSGGALYGITDSAEALEKRRSAAVELFAAGVKAREHAN